MRILTTAILLASATFGAEASSILTIDDNGPVRAPSVLVLNDNAPMVTSMVRLGPPEPIADDPDVIVEGAKDEATGLPFAIPALPTVIRAGIEGDAFARSLVPQNFAPPREIPGVPVAPVPPVAPMAAKQPGVPSVPTVPEPGQPAGKAGFASGKEPDTEFAPPAQSVSSPSLLR